MAADLHERIRRRAYELWQQEGRPEGRADDHWHRAEAQLRGEPEAAGVHAGGGAPPGTSGAGERLCPACGGSGRVRGRRCRACGGTGRIVEFPQP